MDFAHSAKAADYIQRVGDFIRTEIEPVEPEYLRTLHAQDNPYVVLPVIEELKAKARGRGLWNLFLPAGGGPSAPLPPAGGRGSEASIRIGQIWNDIKASAPPFNADRARELIGKAVLGIDPNETPRWL
jgi:hypothetical protein